MDIENLTIKEVRQIAKIAASFVGAPENAENETGVSTDQYIGKLVLVRTYASGVHFGTLKERKGREVILSNSRIVWYWNKAFTLNQLAVNGGGSETKVSVATPETIILDAICFYPITEKVANKLAKYEKDMSK